MDLKKRFDLILRLSFNFSVAASSGVLKILSQFSVASSVAEFPGGPACRLVHSRRVKGLWGNICVLNKLERYSWSSEADCKDRADYLFTR